MTLICRNGRTNFRAFLFIVGLITATFFACKPDEQVDKKEFTMVPLFSDHMVLQQNENVAFWGTYTPGEQVSITPDWGESATTISDSLGNWQLAVPTPAAGGPFKVTLKTNDTTMILNDVLIGEVWLASGQSNMEMPLTGFLPNEPIDNYKQELVDANYSEIRFINIPKSIAAEPATTFNAEWQLTSTESADQFSASAYFFAREINQQLQVPVGIIHSSWGGTPVESWMSKEKMLTLNEFEDELEVLSEENVSKITNWYDNFPKEKVPVNGEEWLSLISKNETFSNINFDDSKWATATLPTLVEKIPTISDDGIYWFRKAIEIEDVSKPYHLTVSEGIDDIDVTFVNGQKIGSTSGWDTPRNYNIPASVFVKGKNTIAIRLIDTGGGGGFMGSMGLSNSAGVSVTVEGEWKYLQTAGIQASNFLLFSENQDALANQPEGIDAFDLNSHTPSVLYNGMIKPLIPYTIKGAIWYQGESNVGRAEQYLKLFPAMISDWREQWKSDFSFYFVQIAPFGYGNSLSPLLRDAQRKSLATKNTGMAIAMDIGLEKSIHPGNKQDVGKRLALLALANDYGKELVSSGPLYKNHTVSGNKIRIEFSHTGTGLMISKPDRGAFEIAGADKKFTAAKAAIVSNTIEVSAASIARPVYVRYAWKDFIEGTLFNKEGLPASSFSTEE